MPSLPGGKIMKRIIEITADFSGVIPNGSFENIRPAYGLKEVITLEEGEIMNDAEVIARQKELQDFNHAQFKNLAEIVYSERIAKECQNVRFYDGKEGRKYPSVTSIINWDASFSIPADQLAQYASRGTVIHKQVEIFLSTGEWKEPKEIPEIYPDLVIVKQGSLGLLLDDVDFKGFYNDYPFKVLEQEKECLNHEWQYGGRLDIKCVIEKSNPGKWTKIDGVVYDVPTILDIKTGSVDKMKHLKQQTAYAHAEGNEDVKQIGIIPLNNGNKCGFSAPILSDVDKYWTIFTRDRENFRKRYGL
jgi:hypothetical protein